MWEKQATTLGITIDQYKIWRTLPLSAKNEILDMCRSSSITHGPCSGSYRATFQEQMRKLSMPFIVTVPKEIIEKVNVSAYVA